jgi:hypothetical protein
MDNSLNVSFWNSEVRSSSIPDNRYFHVAEPSFGSNGTLVFYAGNHFAARFVNSSGWEYVDPYYDFKGTTPSDGCDPGSLPFNFDLFWADQHVLYDKKHDIYIWIRQGKTFDSSCHDRTSNIDRVAISRDTKNWTVYDMQSDLLFPSLGPRIFFDYPQATLGNKYLYLTTSLIDTVKGESYGVIFRFSLNDLGNLTSARYDTLLDTHVEGIAPVNGIGKHNTLYFGAQIPQTNDRMKIYKWNENSQVAKTYKVSIDPWNDIHNVKYCGNSSKYWWCESDYSDSRIRDAWLYKNSINFLWNSITTYDKGRSWVPYIEVATFKLHDKITYDTNTRYRLTGKNFSWIYGAVTPGTDGPLAITAFNASGNITNPYMNLAFGIFNDSAKKWDMRSLLNSTSPLPVINDEMKEDFGWGDFLTIRQHVAATTNDDYIWDIGGFVLVGNRPQDTIPYFTMVKYTDVRSNETAK